MELPTFSHTPAPAERLEPAYATGVTVSAPRSAPCSAPRTHRFAPILQFVTPVDPYVERELRALGYASHEQRRSTDEVCYALHLRASSLGYDATIAVQEVTSRAMPSFAGQTVITPLLLLDLQPSGH